MLAIANDEQLPKPKNGASEYLHRLFLRVDLDLIDRILFSLGLHNPTSPR